MMIRGTIDRSVITFPETSGQSTITSFFLCEELLLLLSTLDNTGRQARLKNC